MNRNSIFRTGIAALILVFVAGFLILGNVQIGPVPQVGAAQTGAAVEKLEPVSFSQEVVSVASQELLSRIYEQTLPAVVNIQVTNQTSDSSFGAPTLPQGGEGTGWIWQ